LASSNSISKQKWACKHCEKTADPNDRANLKQHAIKINKKRIRTQYEETKLSSEQQEIVIARIRTLNQIAPILTKHKKNRKKTKKMTRKLKALETTIKPIGIE